MAAPSLTPAQTSKVRRLAQPKEIAPGEEAGELNVVPYLDILMNLLMFVLATVAVTFVSSVDATPPRSNPILAGKPPMGLALTVLVAESGYAIKTAGGNVGPGCDHAGEGLAVPKAKGSYDLAGLTACVAKIKESAPEASNEDQVTLAAGPGVAYADVIATMDALRGERDRPLFPRIAFGVVR